MKGKIALFAALVTFVSCHPAPPKDQQKDPCEEKSGRQLNITVFLDLSDRITKDYGYGPQAQIDTAVVLSIVDLFRKDAQSRSTYCAKGMMRFRADPPTVSLDACIANTETDFSALSIQQRGEHWTSMRDEWSKSIGDLYKEASASVNNSGGSDIGSFVRDVDQYIVDGYHNVLIIFTDGEVYQKAYSGVKDGGLVGNITSKTLNPYFRPSETASLQAMEKAGLGLINPRISKPPLTNLDVIVIGLRPNHPSSPFIYPLLEFIWKDWFNRMGLPRDHLTLVKAASTTDSKVALLNALGRSR